MEDNYKIDETVSHLFRQESGKMVSVLVKIFGTENYELAEDVVQDSLVKALETWKFRGIPDNPKAWLYRAAKNKAIDIIRREKHNQTIDFNDPERKLLTSAYTLKTTMNTFWEDGNIKDDFLGMMYACCHPDISEENQVTFILKSLCGFSTKEIAKAFLTTEDTISKRLYRTKERFRKTKLKPEIPSPEKIAERTDAVLNSIYLLFNEGYNATNSDELIRKDLIVQAINLCGSLLENEKTKRPEVYALMALMHFHSARNAGRLTLNGGLISLPHQDRTKWNKDLIYKGNEYLNKAAFGEKVSEFHLEAAIAYEHCIATNYESTNWRMILHYYDLLWQVNNDPVILLNRSIVLMELNEIEKALDSLNALKDNLKIQKYYLFYAVMGEISQRLGKIEQAVSLFEQARKLTHAKQEKQFLMEKIACVRN